MKKIINLELFGVRFYNCTEQEAVVLESMFETFRSINEISNNNVMFDVIAFLKALLQQNPKWQNLIGFKSAEEELHDLAKDFDGDVIGHVALTPKTAVCNVSSNTVKHLKDTFEGDTVADIKLNVSPDQTFGQVFRGSITRYSTSVPGDNLSGFWNSTKRYSSNKISINDLIIQGMSIKFYVNTLGVIFYVDFFNTTDSSPRCYILDKDTLQLLDQLPLSQEVKEIIDSTDNMNVIKAKIDKQLLNMVSYLIAEKHALPISDGVVG